MLRRAVVLALVAVLGLGSPAGAADPTVEWCAKDAVCLWDGTGFTGTKATIYWSTIRHWCTAVPSFINNQASSVWNTNPFTVYLRDSGACGGSYYPVFAGEKEDDMSTYRDRTSAVSVTASL